MFVNDSTDHVIISGSYESESDPSGTTSEFRIQGEYVFYGNFSLGVSFLGLFFSLPSIFVSLGCIFYLFLNNRELRKKLVLFGCALCGCFLVMYILFLSPHAASASWLKEMDMWKTSFPDLQNFWTIPLWLIERHAGYMSAYPTGGRNFGSLITFILQLIGVLVWYRSGRRKHLFLLWSSLPFLFSAAAIQAYPYGGSVRVAIFLAPAIVAGVMTLGVMQQIIRAFGRVEGSLQYLFRAWPTIIELASVYKRLREFENKILINIQEDNNTIIGK